jgi:hypothetical protein
MFQKLCGPDAFKNVILVTTMWESVNQSDGGEREEELCETSEFWGMMMKRGSQTVRHYNNQSSAEYIVDIIVSSTMTKETITMAIQHEMVNQNKQLDETGAGKELEGALAEERERSKRALADLEAQMKEALDIRDKEQEDLIRELQEETNIKIAQLQRERENLKINLETLHADKYAKLERRLQELELGNQKSALETAKEINSQKVQQLQKEAARTQEELDEMKGQVSELTEALKVKPETHVRSHPGENQIDEHRSLSICGIHYAFVGPKSDEW